MVRSNLKRDGGGGCTSTKILNTKFRDFSMCNPKNPISYLLRSVTTFETSLLQGYEVDFKCIYKCKERQGEGECFA